MLPKRREKPRSGIERAPKREWPRHRAWVRTHGCCIEGKGGHVCRGPIVFAHARSSRDGGTGMKPADWWGISLCDGAHQLQHLRGERLFEMMHGIDMKKLAAEFAAKSPDLKMKEAMRNG